MCGETGIASSLSARYPSSCQAKLGANLVADELSGWKRTAAQMSIINLGLQIFTRDIVKHGYSGLPFSSEFVDAIKQRSIITLKNADVSGIKIEDEANLLREGIEILEKLIDGTLAEARKDE